MRVKNWSIFAKNGLKRLFLAKIGPGNPFVVQVWGPEWQGIESAGWEKNVYKCGPIRKRTRTLG